MRRRTTEDEAVAECRAAGLEPLEPFKKVAAPWRARCTTCGAEVSPRLDGIRAGHGGCRSCGLKAAHARKYGDRAAAAVEVMSAAGLEPLEPYPGTTSWWNCRCGRCGETVRTKHDKVKQGAYGCAACSYRLRGLKRRVPSADAFAEMQAAGFEPLEPYVGSHTPWRSRCQDCRQQSTPTLASVRHQNTGCRYCNKPTHEAEDAVERMQAVGLQPLEPFVAAHAPWRVLCLDCGRESAPRLSKVLLRGKVCKWCSGKAVEPSDAVATMRAHGYEPLEPYPGSLKLWRCRCLTCGRDRHPTHALVKSQGTRCGYCMHKVVDPDDAEAIMRSAGIHPLVSYPGASSPWRCRCGTCGRTISPTLGTVRRGGRCRFCATKGINLKAPCLVYLITHLTLGAHKIGIGAPSGYRLRKHRREGWEVYRTKRCATGAKAFDIEQRVLEWLRIDLGLPPALSKAEMPQAGYTETVASSAVELPDVWAIVEKASKRRRKIAE